MNGNAIVKAVTSSGVLLGSAAFCIVGFAGCALGIAVEMNLLLFIGVVGAGSYLVDHVGDAAAPASANRVRFGAGCLAALLLVALAQVMLRSGWAYVTAIAYPMSVAVYGWIKAVPYIKTFYVPALWGALVLLPLATAVNPPAWLPVVALFLLVTAQVAVMANACDLRDAAQDRLLGIRTLATKYPPKRLLGALHYCNAAIAVGALLLTALGVLAPCAMVVALHAVLVAVVLRHMRCARPASQLLLTGIVLDGALSLQYPLALLLLGVERAL